MATSAAKRSATSTRKPAGKSVAKAAAKRPSPRRRATTGSASLADAVREVEHAITEDLHRELEAARKLLEGVGRDLRDISERIESTIEDLARREGSTTTRRRGKATGRSTTKRAPAKRTSAKRGPAKRTPAKRTAAKRTPAGSRSSTSARSTTS